MSLSDTEHAGELARNLVDLLTVYEEELMALEAGAPRMGQLRRAVGICIAEAHYLISDQSEIEVDIPASGEDRARHANR